MLATLLAAALSATPASPLEAPPAAPARIPGVGRVVQVTGARAYLDAGASSGLTPGQVLTLWRGDAEAGTCTVEAVAAAHATCTGGRPRPGDAFKLGPAPSPPPGAPKVVELPPLTPDEELARRAEAVAGGPPVALVEYKAAAQPAGPALVTPRAVVAEAALTHASWMGGTAGDYHVERVEAAVHGAPLGAGFSADLDLRAERWLSRSTGAVFRPNDDTRLYVWQAQLGWAPEGRSLAVSAGRLLPWTVPGATVMDGALVSMRREGIEGGFFGGVVPEPDTLSPTSSRATGGGFWSLERRPRKGLVLRHEGRLAWVRSPELGDRVELEVNGSAHAGAQLDLFAAARLGAGGSDHAPGYVDGARVEAGWRPIPRLALTGGVEYGGLGVPLAIVPPALGAETTKADATGFYDLGFVRVGAVAGTSVDRASKLDRTWVGPEVQLPRFFTPRVALSAGYVEELGWMDGRSAFLQCLARPWDPVRITGRLSWNHESSLGMDMDEAGLYLAGAAELNRWLGLRLSGLARLGITGGGEGEGGSGMSSAYSGTLTLYAVF
jgi:hypothetical protein